MSTHTILELMSSANLQGRKINIQKSIIFLHTSNEKSKLEINKAFSFMYIKRIK